MQVAIQMKFYFFFFSDVNECDSDGNNCQHICRNEAGSHSCECYTGYELQQDGYSCSGLFSLDP